jgi:hypothetical protein
MAKRGGGFNKAGAYGWEWFAIQLDAHGGLGSIEWRGSMPPDDPGYGTDCNSCHHRTGAYKDDVLSLDVLR